MNLELRGTDASGFLRVNSGEPLSQNSRVLHFRSELCWMDSALCINGTATVRRRIEHLFYLPQLSYFVKLSTWHLLWTSLSPEDQKIEVSLVSLKEYIGPRDLIIKTFSPSSFLTVKNKLWFNFIWLEFKPGYEGSKHKLLPTQSHVVIVFFYW